jgi:hypothetical protein
MVRKKPKKTKAQKAVTSALQELDLEVESRCDEVRSHGDSLVFSLQCQVRSTPLRSLQHTVSSTNSLPQHHSC